MIVLLLGKITKKMKLEEKYHALGGKNSFSSIKGEENEKILIDKFGFQHIHQIPNHELLA